jgi:predicted Zn finger-like uncharacterized protein
MYSQCPECLARFRVTADDLRAAHGTVRCGRCGSAFDALPRLSDAVPPARPDQVDRSGEIGTPVITAAPEPLIATEYHFTADDLDKVFIDAQDWQRQFGIELSAEELPTLTLNASTPPVVLVDENEAIEDITLEGERIRFDSDADIELGDLDSTDEFQVVRDIPDSAYPEESDEPRVDAIPEAPPAAATLLSTDAAAEPVVTAPEPDITAATPAPPPLPRMTAADAASPTLAEQRWRRPADETAAARPDREREERSGWRTFAWTVACLVLAVALLAQVTHYYRQQLVRHPQLGPLLRDVYQRLGVPLSPNWDLAAFELRQWGNSGGPDTSGRLHVRASLTNRAPFAQPQPILRLELEDRFGGTLAVRDFEPREYLKNPSEAPRLLAPGASTEADLLVADPGQDAVGYRLDVCLRESVRLLRCAQGPG